MIDSTATVAARVRGLAPEQQSLLILRLRDHVRRRAAESPSLPASLDELSDEGVEELLTQMLAADSEAAAAVAAEPSGVEHLSDDEVAAMLTTLLGKEGE